MLENAFTERYFVLQGETLLNADVNIAYNIISKVNSSAIDHLIGVEGVVNVG